MAEATCRKEIDLEIPAEEVARMDRANREARAAYLRELAR